MPKGDVNLWGFEGPSTLKETIEESKKKINFFNMLALRLMDEENFCPAAVKELKFCLQINTHKIKNLCEAKVRHEILRNSFNKRIQKFPNQGSRYILAFAKIDAFIAKSDLVIKKLLNMNVEWCRIMAEVNGNLHEFKKESPVSLDDQDSGLILLKDDFMDLMYGRNFLENHPEFIKQRSDHWFKLHERSHITGSTMHDALGLRTLKSQKNHLDKFVMKTATKTEPNEAMLHGSKHEVLIYCPNISG